MSNAASPGPPPRGLCAVGWRRDAPPGSYAANHAAGTLVLIAFDRLVLFDRGVVFFRRRGDVVRVDVLVGRAPVFIRVVETSHRALLDRALGSAIAVLARGLALVFRWRVGAEIAVPGPAGCAGAAGVGAGREAARSRRAAESTR